MEQTKWTYECGFGVEFVHKYGATLYIYCPFFITEYCLLISRQSEYSFDSCQLYCQTVSHRDLTYAAIHQVLYSNNYVLTSKVTF